MSSSTIQRWHTFPVGSQNPILVDPGFIYRVRSFCKNGLPALGFERPDALADLAGSVCATHLPGGKTCFFFNETLFKVNYEAKPADEVRISHTETWCGPTGEIVGSMGVVVVNTNDLAPHELLRCAAKTIIRQGANPRDPHPTDNVGWYASPLILSVTLPWLK